MKNVLKLSPYLFLVGSMFLQGCQPLNGLKNDQQTPQLKRDLSKAASYNTQLGLAYLKQGNRPRAKQKLITALIQAPLSPDVQAAMAYYFEQTNEMDQANQHYLKAIALSSNAGDQLNNYGTFLCRQGYYKKSEGYFLKAIKDKKYIHTAAAYENAGFCSLPIPDYVKAKRYFIEALNQDPLRKASLYELVKLESKMGNDREALKNLQKYPNLVFNDLVFLALAKDVASRAGNGFLAAQYEKNFNQLESNTENSGVNNDYSSHNG